MELRTQNVLSIYDNVVKTVISDKIGTNENLAKHLDDIKDMISQVKVDNKNCFVLMQGHIRKDEEQWTPYLQPVVFLVQLAYRAKFVTYDGDLKPNTVIQVISDDK